MIYNTGKPWTARKESDGTYVRSRHGGLVARMESGSQVMRDLDARLVAAAPDMLAALERAWVAYGAAGTETDRAIAYEQIFLAIQKAKGVFNAPVR